MIKIILAKKMFFLSLFLGLAIAIIQANFVPSALAESHEKSKTPPKATIGNTFPLTQSTYTAVAILREADHKNYIETAAIFVISPLGHYWLLGFDIEDYHSQKTRVNILKEGQLEEFPKSKKW